LDKNNFSETYIEPEGVLTDMKIKNVENVQARLLDLAHVLIRDTNDRIVSWNTGAEELYGFSRDEVIGRVSHDLLRTVFPLSKEAVAEALATSGDWQGELVHTTKGGRKVVVASHQIMYRDEDGKPIAIMEVNNDVTAQKRTEEALRESEQRLGLAVNATGIGIFESNSLTGDIAATEQFGNIIGLSIKEATLTTESTLSHHYHRDQWAERIYPEDWSGLRAKIDKCQLQHLPLDVEYRVVCDNASERWVNVRGVFLDDDQGNPTRFLGIIMDITERKQAEEDLQRTRFMFSEGQRIAHLGTFEYEADTRQTVWSDEECLIYGLEPGTPSPPYNEMLKRFIHPDDATLLDDTFRKAIQNGSFYELEHRIVRPDGSVRVVQDLARPYFDADGKLIKYIGTTLDITERRQTEEALVIAHSQAQSIIDNTTAIIYAFDLEERFLIANTAVAELLNSTPEQMIGKRRHEFMPSDDADWHEANDRQVIEAGNALEFEEYSKLGGRSLTWLTTKFPLRDAQGMIYAVAGISADITDRKTHEQHERELDAHKRDFYRKTILAATSGKLQIVEPEEIRALRGDLVQRWRFSTPDEYSLTLGHSFEAAEKLGFVDDNLHRFMACAGEMLGNAQKHCGGGEASFYRSNNRIVFIVSDTGPGIDSINLPDIAFVIGYSTVGTGGLGYKFIIGSADKTYLATGPDGTTVAIEIELCEPGFALSGVHTK